MEARRLSLVLEPQHENICIGDLLRQELGLSSAHVRRIKWLDHGILLDGEKVPTCFRGKRGQTLSPLIGEIGRKSEFLSVAGELDIVHEDEDFLVVNKQAGVVVHPTLKHFDDTLCNFLLYYYDQIGFQGDFHPVHRLDRGTSGLIVVAKHPFAQEQFTRQLHSPIFSREYIALVWGQVEPLDGTIEGAIHQKEKMIRCVDNDLGLPAVTHYNTLATGELEGKPLSLVALKLETGRTHQIRVHMTYKGYPLLGDELYGKGDVLAHTALHAFRLSLHQPVTKEGMTFTAAPPEDFLQVFAQSGMVLPEEFQWILST